MTIDTVVPEPVAGAGLPGLILGERCRSRLVATAAEERLSFTAHFVWGSLAKSGAL
jgi:hypothetical protein